MDGLKGSRVVNVVATGDLKQVVDLVEVSRLPYTIYDAEIYGGRAAYLKAPEMHGKVTIFPSGKFISVGTRSPGEAQKDLETTVETLASNGLIKPIKISAKVRNVVGFLNLGSSIDLERLAEKEGGIYEPEQFPGLIMRNSSPKATFLIFASGKVVVAGCRSLEELKQAAERVQEITREQG